MASLVTLPLEVRRMIWKESLAVMSEMETATSSSYSVLHNHIYWLEFIRPRRTLRLVNKQVKAEVEAIPISVGLRWTDGLGLEVFVVRSPFVRSPFVRSPGEQIYLRDAELNFNDDAYRCDMTKLIGYWNKPGKLSRGEIRQFEALLHKYQQKVERALSKYGRVTTISLEAKDLVWNEENRVFGKTTNRPVLKFDPAQTHCK